MECETGTNSEECSAVSLFLDISTVYILSVDLEHCETCDKQYVGERGIMRVRNSCAAVRS